MAPDAKFRPAGYRSRLITSLFTMVFCLVQFPRLAASPLGDITAVAAQTAEGYVREKSPDGTFKKETYVFGDGGRYGGTFQDASIDHMQFLDVARIIAQPLAKQNFLPATDAAQTRLLIMVYWGMTISSSERPYSSGTASGNGSPLPAHSSLAEKDDVKNARLLGYDAEGIIGTDFGRGLMLTAMRQKVIDITDEIRDNRYFVVLMAYDFQLMWKEKKPKLLWETRFSLREKSNAFDESLPMMAQFASRYFGQDTHGLIRRPLRETINLGELQILGVESARTNQVTPAESYSAEITSPIDPELIRDLQKNGPGPAMVATPSRKSPVAATLPLEMRERIAAYQHEKDALQAMLEGRLKNRPPATDPRGTIDAFNRENALRIAALNQRGENIRWELSSLPTTTTQPPVSAGQPLDHLRREFIHEVKQLELPANSAR